MRRSPTRRFVGPLLASSLIACATANPRFPQDVAASFARDDMRRMETEHLELYYPAAHAEEAGRIAARLEQCATKLRARQTVQRERDRFLVFLTSAEFNNAYVQPGVLGNPQQMVLPLHLTLDHFDLYDVGTNGAGDISCHEAVHYVTAEQVQGFWRALNDFFGPIFPPTGYLDSWFQEGMATYYEARLGKPVGRPLSPFWRSAFEAGIASEARLDPGLLSHESRVQSAYGGPYLTGMAFVEYLADRFGEEKLWKLIDKQARSIFSPLGVTLRFRSIYGQSIGSLFDDFKKELAERAVERKRPAGQRVIAKEIGHLARSAVAADGTIATVASGLDEPPRLVLREKDGSERASLPLTRVLPFRSWIVSTPFVFSGLSFSPDARWLYLVAADLDSDSSFTARLWKVDARTAEVVRLWDEIPGSGGCVTGDGEGYVFVANVGDRASLVRLNLEDGDRETLATFAPGVSITAPACSREDDRIAFALRGERGLDLHLREADASIFPLTDDGRFNTQPGWLDPGHLAFVREHEGRAQIHVMDLSSRRFWPATDVPFGAFDPSPSGSSEVVFLNREGWGFSLDSAPVPLDAPTEVAFRTASTLPPPRPIPGLSSVIEPLPPLEVKKDAPYSAFDHLFVPTLRVPYLTAIAQDDGTARYAGSLSLQGSDRLGYHLWALNLAFDSADDSPSLNMSYGNQLLAPWSIEVSGSLINVGPAYDRSVELAVGRTFWTSPVRLQLAGIEHHEIGLFGGRYVAFERLRFVGPGLQAAWAAAEQTPYGGIRRGLALATRGNYYPSFAGSDFDLGDVGGAATIWLPLPFSKRHSFSVSGKSRALISSGSSSLLEIGGLARGTPIFQGSQKRSFRAADATILPPPELPFSEGLRGYPDLITRGDAVAAASASYLYPFIVDRGWASFLYLLPAFFIRQVDVELFGEMAWIWPRAWNRRSAGGALHLRTTWGNVPLTLYLEGAARFDANRDPLATVGLAIE